MVSYETILFEKKDNIGIITLNRPEVMNAFNDTMISELRDLQSEIISLFNSLQNSPSPSESLTAPKSIWEHVEIKSSILSFIQYYPCL